MKEILVSLRDPAFRRIVTNALEGLEATLRDAPSACAPSLIVTDPASLADLPAPMASALSGPPPLLVCTGPLDRNQLADCVAIPSFRALVARDAPSTHRALVTAAGELLGAAPEPPPEAPYRTQLTSSHDREGILESLSEHLRGAGIRGRAIERLINAVEELITNAIYDAPTDSEGRRLYADVDRRMAVHLSRARQPELTVAVRDGLVYATMRDPYGSLEAGAVQSFLAQGLRGDFADKAGGAGLGFLRIYAVVDALNVRVQRGVSTEIAIRIDANRTRRDPGARPNDLLIVDRAPPSA